MTFATVNVNREQLMLLNQLLLTVFPGCTIHQNRDPVRVVQHLSNRKVDAVFADADAYSDLVPILKRQRLETSVYLLCKQERQSTEGTEGVRGIVTYPVTKQKIQNALQTGSREIREVV